MTVYYNEIDKYAAQWLRNLIAAGHIAPGDVDERSIEDVHPDDLRGYTQCHFFAGIGVWSYALRRAGWPDDRPVWTGSCPCQPFSAAGKGAGFDDERHLWPAWHHLIKQRRPPEIFGEQVASKDAGPWIDLVHTDLEALDYAFGAVPFPSASVGAPHIRDRLYWVANARSAGLDQRKRVTGVFSRKAGSVARQAVDRIRIRNAGGMGHPSGSTGQRDARGISGTKAEVDSPRRVDGSVPFGPEHAGSGVGRMADTSSERWIGRQGIPTGSVDDGTYAGRLQDHNGLVGVGEAGNARDTAGPVNGFWSDADWLLCRDGKWRPVESGTFPLAHGAASRVGRLRAYGNAINAQAAEAFIRAAM